MSKLPAISSQQLITALNKAGFVFIRQRGSHIRLQKQTDKGIIKDFSGWLKTKFLWGENN